MEGGEARREASTGRCPCTSGRAPARGAGARAVLLGADEGRLDTTSDRPRNGSGMSGIGGRCSRRPDRAQLVGDGRRPTSRYAQDVARELDRPEEVPRIQLGTGCSSELERGHDSEVAATAAKRPEEVAVLARRTRGSSLRRRLRPRTRSRCWPRDRTCGRASRSLRRACSRRRRRPERSPRAVPGRAARRPRRREPREPCLDSCRACSRRRRSKPVSRVMLSRSAPRGSAFRRARRGLCPALRSRGRPRVRRHGRDHVIGPVGKTTAAGRWSAARFHAARGGVPAQRRRNCDISLHRRARVVGSSVPRSSSRPPRSSIRPQAAEGRRIRDPRRLPSVGARSRPIRTRARAGGPGAA